MHDMRMASTIEAQDERHDGNESDTDLLEAIRLSLLEDNRKDEEDADLMTAIKLSLLHDVMENTTEKGFRGLSEPPVQDDPNYANLRDLYGATGLSLKSAEPAHVIQQPGFRLHHIMTSPEFDGPSGRRYVYEPLERPRDIRLLLLQTGPSDTGQIECSLLRMSLDGPDLPTYTTISYAWGETFEDGSHLTNAINCNGTPLKVTKSLHRALVRIREVRRRSKSNNINPPFLWLWVDGICINQADSEERSRQVKLMAEIYAGCQSMIIWLGEHSDNAIQWLETFSDLFPGLDASSVFPPAASIFASQSHTDSLTRYLSHMSSAELATLNVLLRRPCFEVPCFMSLREALSTSHHLGRGGTVNPQAPISKLFEPSRDRAAHVQLVQRPWFRRKWVVQEVAQTSRKPRQILIADKVLDFKMMVEQMRVHSLLGAASPLGATLSNNTLLRNLAQYNNTQSSDPHDHIYALLGISKDSSWVTVDYKRNVNELYTSVAEYYVNKGNYLAVLALATVKKSTRRLPSWVPDWREAWQSDRSTMQADAMATFSFGARKFFGDLAPNPKSSVVTLCGSRQILELKAWVIPQCDSADLHDSTECNKCRLFAEFGASRHGEGAKRPSAGEDLRQGGKRKMREFPISGGDESLLTMRAATGKRKWASIILEQFEAIIHPDETLCLVDGSPLGFVLRSTTDVEPFPEERSYTLEFCFQVDEEGLMSDWFANELGRGRQQRICIV